MGKKIKIIDLLCYISIGDYSELPERFCFKEVTFKLNENKNYVSTTSGLLLTKYLDNDYLEMDLNSEIETLDEEDEFEDIESFGVHYSWDYIDYKNIEELKKYVDKDFQNIFDTLDKLIKNQKKIIERLNNLDNN